MPVALTLSLNTRDPAVEALHRNLRKLGYVIPDREYAELWYGPGTVEVVRKLQGQYSLAVTGVFDEVTARTLSALVTQADTIWNRVEGRVYWDLAHEPPLPAVDLPIRVYRRGFGGSQVLLGEVRTDAQGSYALPYEAGGTAPHLEVRTLDPQGAEVALSDTLRGAGKREQLNLVAPISVRPLEPEFQRLASALIREAAELGRLAQAQETEQQKDLSLLHAATGWDARVIALAVTAVKNSRETGLPTEVLYGLYRAGLPIDAGQLALVLWKDVEEALRGAIAAGIVSARATPGPDVQKAFESFAISRRRLFVNAGGLSTVGEFLDKSGLSTAQRTQFETLYFSHEGGGEELWTKARALGLPDAAISSLRLQGKLAYLTLNNSALVESLGSQLGAQAELDALVRLDLHTPEAWKAQLGRVARGDARAIDRLIPPAYKGAQPSERLDAYAADMARSVRVSFPMQVLGRRLEKDELRLGANHATLKIPVQTFLRNAIKVAPDFVLGQRSLHAFLAEHRDALFAGIPATDIGATTEAIKQLARLYQTTPSDHALKVVLDQGFRSAHEIADYPHDVFLARFGSQFASLREASLVYRQAQQIDAVTLNLFASLKHAENTPALYGISGPAKRRLEDIDQLKDTHKHIPTLETLFGSLDFCECQQCRSVLSPAAYFVDLLKTLDPKKAPGDTAKTPYEVLIRRRPDLPYLALTCENTNTALPYIDLANEILESYVANRALPADAASVHNTGSSTTAELLAEPAYVLEKAYQVLAGELYPLALPFDLPIESVRILLAHMNASLPRLLQAMRKSDALFAPSGTPTDEPTYDRAAILSESLGLSPMEVQIFTDADIHHRWPALYGHSTESEAKAALGSAKELARRLAVTYAELDSLVATQFVNPLRAHPTAALYLSSPDSSCSFDATALVHRDGTPADALEYLRLNLFVRLWRKLGGTIAALDELLALFIPSSLQPIALAGLGRALQGALVHLANYLTLTRRLDISERNRQKLLSLWSATPPDAAERLLRTGFLATALKLSESELETLAKLSEIDPVSSPPDTSTGGGTWQTLQFVDLAGRVKDSGVSLVDLDYLLTHQFDPLGPYRGKDQLPGTLLRTLTSQIRQIQTEHHDPVNLSDFSAADLVEKLRLLLPADEVERFVAFRDKKMSSGDAQAFANQQLDGVLPYQKLVQPGIEEVNQLLARVRDRLIRQVMTSTVASALGADPILIDTLVNEETILRDPKTHESLSTRFRSSTQVLSQGTNFDGYVDVPSTGIYRFHISMKKPIASATIQVVLTTSAQVLSLQANASHPQVTGSILLEAGVLHGLKIVVSGAAVDAEVEIEVQGPNIPRGPLEQLVLHSSLGIEGFRRAYVLLGKVVQLASAIRLSIRELKYMASHKEDFGGLDLSTLPTSKDDVSDAKARFQQFIQLAEYVHLRDKVAGGTDELINVFESATLDTGVDRFAALTLRDKPVVRQAARHLAFTTGLLTPQRVLRLWEILSLAATLGASVEQLADWASIVLPTNAADPGHRNSVAARLREFVKSRYGRTDWLRVAPSLSDPLRKKRRDALVAYILNHHPDQPQSIDQLYEIFLLDPGAEPVVQTSRIRLAISSVQLFVQRCLMNLEQPEVAPTAINAQHWQWMKRYRVWEANRKIFLFPENWLEPSWRDDKTPLFKELESSLLQGDVSDDLVEAAFSHYLRKLKELAKLDIVTMYRETKPDDVDSSILHVIGRSGNHPRKYYYRRLANGMWTPWEPVNTDIDGDHVAAVVWRGRLHLFWVTFLEKANQDHNNDKTPKQLAERPVSEGVQRTVEFQINWSEYDQGQWTPRVSGGFSDPIKLADPLKKADIFFYAIKIEKPDNKSAASSEEVSIYLGEPISSLCRILNKNESVVSLDYKNIEFDYIVFNQLGPRPMEVNATRFMFSDPSQLKFLPERFGGSVLQGIIGSSTILASRPVAEVPFWLTPCLTSSTELSKKDAAAEFPFFYQDSDCVFMVQPSRINVPIHQWDGWLQKAASALGAALKPHSDLRPIIPQFAPASLPKDPGEPHLSISPLARYATQRELDWMQGENFALRFGDRLIRQTGGVSVASMPTPLADH